MDRWELSTSQNRLLSGMWGTLQRASEERLTTERVWSSLRSRAAEWSLQARGLPPAASVAEEQELGRQVLSQQGIQPGNVSVWRGEAGRWRRAGEVLNGLGADEQITSEAIFTPPWAKTAGAGVPSRYHARSLWQIEDSEGAIHEAWRTDEVETPLTTKRYIEEQLSSGELPTSPPIFLMAAAPPVLKEMHLEQI